MTRFRTIIVSVCVVAIGLSVVLLARSWSRIVGSGGGTGSIPETPLVDEDLIASASERPDHEIRALLDSISRTAPRDIEAVGDRNALVGAAEAALRGYLSPSPQGFEAMLQQQGVEPPPIASRDPERWERMWPRAQALFAHAIFDPESIAWRRVNEAQDYQSASDFVRVGRRDSARSFLDRYRREDLLAYELQLPGDLLAQDGTSFGGTVSYRFVYNPDLERWVLVQLAIEGIPNQAMVMLPPL